MRSDVLQSPRFVLPGPKFSEDTVKSLVVYMFWHESYLIAGRKINLITVLAVLLCVPG